MINEFFFLIEQSIWYEENSLSSATFLQVLVSLKIGNPDLGIMYSANFETCAALDKSPSFLVL